MARMNLNGTFSLWERWPNQTGVNTTMELYIDTPGGSIILFSINTLVQIIAIVSQIIALCSQGRRCVNLSKIGCISVALCQFIVMLLDYYYTKKYPWQSGFPILAFIVAIVYLLHFFPRLIMIPVGLISFIIAAFTFPLWIWPVCCCLCCCKYCMVYCKTHRPDSKVTAHYREVGRYSGIERRRWEESYIDMRKETKAEKWARRTKRMNKELEEREKIRKKIIKKREERGSNEIELNVTKRNITE